MKYKAKPLNKMRDVSMGNYQEFWTKKTLISLISICLVLFLMFQAIDFALSYFPDSLEVKLFSKAEAFKETKVFPETQARVEKILNKILTSNENLRALPYQIKIIDRQYENAFASIGGKIYITKELTKNNQEDSSLAFIIAHELAHHQLRHCTRGRGKSFLYTAITNFINPEGLLSLQLVPVFTMQASSRSWERAADKLAFSLMQNAYSDLSHFLDFFEADAKNHSALNNLDQSYLGSHPASQERIKYLRSLEASSNKK